MRHRYRAPANCASKPLQQCQHHGATCISFRKGTDRSFDQHHGRRDSRVSSSRSVCHAQRCCQRRTKVDARLGVVDPRPAVERAARPETAPRKPCRVQVRFRATVDDEVTFGPASDAPSRRVLERGHVAWRSRQPDVQPDHDVRRHPSARPWTARTTRPGTAHDAHRGHKS